MINETQAQGKQQIAGAINTLFTIFEKIEKAHADGITATALRKVYVKSTNNDPMVMSFVDIAISQVYS